MQVAKALIWGFGKIVIFTGLLACIGCLIFWIRVEKKGTLFKLKFWSTQATHQLVLTYFHLITSYLLSFTSYIYVLSSPKLLELISGYPYEVIFGVIAAITIFLTLLEFIPYCPENNLIKIITWLLHSVILGFPIAYFGSELCTIATLQTTLMFALCSVMSFLAPDDFYKLFERTLNHLYIIVTISSVICLQIEYPFSTVYVFFLTINFFGGIMLYFGVLIVNTQFLLNDILTNENYDPIYTSAVVYLCTMNLFIRNALYNMVQCSKI